MPDGLLQLDDGLDAVADREHPVGAFRRSGRRAAVLVGAGDAGPSRVRTGSAGGKIPALVFLSAIGFFIKATFGLAVLGTTAGIALTDRRAALRYFALAMSAMLAIIALLGIVFGREFFIQAFLFQAMKGPLPLAHRFNSFFIATNPILIPAIAGFLSQCSDLRWKIVALMSLFTSALVLMGPTYWSHNAIDPLVPMTLLAAAGWDEARKIAKGNPRVLFARTACSVSLLLLAFLGAGGRMPFVTEGVDRSEIMRAARAIEDLGRAGTVMYAPSVLIFETNSSGYIRHPEFYGVYLWIKETADRDGVLATLRSASADTFSARMARQKGRWEEDVYRAIEESRLKTVVYEPLRSDSADALDPERLQRAGMAPIPGAAGFYQIWTK